MELSLAKIDLIAGITAGISGVVVSHPLDTIKVRIQSSSTPVTMRYCLRQMYQLEGVRGFWRGMAAPVVARIPLSGVLFSAQGFSQRMMEPYDNMSIYLKDYLSGFFAGFCFTNTAFIFDLLKVRAQQRKQKKMSYAVEIKRIYSEEGLKGFTRGYQGMIFRDGPGFAIYFCLFSALKRFWGVSDTDRANNYNGKSSAQVGALKFLAGGLSGCVTWTAAYPADVFKTNI